MTETPPTPNHDEPEEVFFEGPMPVKACLGKHGLFYFILLGWNVGLLIAWLQSKSIKVKITSQRLVIIRGLVSQSEEDIPLYRGKDIAFKQTVAGRMLGAGVITFYSDDATAPELSFPCLQPKEYKEKIRDCMMKERQRFRTRTFD